MAGHSKWAQIKRKKAANDAKRGKLITKHMRAISAAARSGGGPDPAGNVQLRNAIEAAKRDDVPAENIDRLLAKLRGEGDGATKYEDIVYEGYAPGGVALLVMALTDNRNRTAGEVRHVFTKHGGSLGASGAVAWQFERKGLIVLSVASEEAEEAAIDAGAIDLEESDGVLEVYTEPNEVYNVARTLEEAGFKPDSVEITMIPQNTTALSQEDAQKVLRMIEALEDLDDVQNVYSNLDLTGVEA